MLGANGVVGANIQIAAGAAHAIRLRGEDRIVCCIFGDGAVNRGPFLEGLNWARVYDLAVLFVCEDNGFAATTRTAALTGGPGPLARAESLGIPGAAVDGNDLLAVEAAAAELLARVRAGEGPQFLWAKTYRLAGHTAADPATYRPAAEVEARWERDPIPLTRALLLEGGVAARDLDAAEGEERAAIAAAVAEAEAAPWPEAALAFTDVQDLGVEVVPGHG
jgi:pyruvate dehydrogenase E1 component alpha subunit